MSKTASTQITVVNPALREWHTKNLGRLPGLKFMRTLWVCNVAEDPSNIQPRNQAANQEKKEVLAAFAAHKGEVTVGYLATSTKGR